MSERQKKIQRLYQALKDGWQVQMIPGKTSNVFELTKAIRRPQPVLGVKPIVRRKRRVRQ